MTNHLHLIVGVNQESNLSRFMKRVNLKYVYYYCKKYTYCGHLWQDRFKGKVINNERYFIRCGKYIELNPVRAGIVSSPEYYQFSSYHYYAFGKEDKLITENPIYEDLGRQLEVRQSTYRSLVAEEENEKSVTKIIVDP
jgi:putative transposase